MSISAKLKILCALEESMAELMSSELVLVTIKKAMNC
jgi:hypothetical protein